MRNNCDNLCWRAVQINSVVVDVPSSPTTGCVSRRWIQAVCPARYGCYSNVSAFRTVEFAGSRYVSCLPVHMACTSP